jgi:hypothetical protein
MKRFVLVGVWKGRAGLLGQYDTEQEAEQHQSLALKHPDITDAQFWDQNNPPSYVTLSPAKSKPEAFGKQPDRTQR